MVQIPGDRGFESISLQQRFESASLQQRVGCELDSWIMVGADGLGSKEDVRVFSLIVLAQFVWRVRLQRSQRGVRKWWQLRIECPDLIVLFGGPDGMCGNTTARPPSPH